VRFAIRHEAARSIEDILARRTRALFLDAKAAESCIECVGEILVEELALSPERLKAMSDQVRHSARRFQLLSAG
ncbi:MAG TPA: glycerol-3-phosphate dehydrogenase C-terminal domain-containing protein, partial [Azonexus sp.]|nr:glycerol-3-phosphate dehydrogenase C-terminal domain-containing protein [Azonexus sp.]